MELETHKLAEVVRKDYLNDTGKSVEDILQEKQVTNIEAIVILMVLACDLAQIIHSPKESFMDMASKFWDNAVKLREQKKKEENEL